MDEEYLRGRELPTLDIDLQDEKLFGRSFRYFGTETLTYRLNDDGKLLGFCGNGKKIAIDGREYTFTGNEGWFCFAPLAEKHLAQGVKAAVVVYSEQAGSVTIPNNFGSTNLKAAACKRSMLAVERDIPVTADSETITICFDKEMADKNALIYVL
jgi:hypothetical protein